MILIVTAIELTQRDLSLIQMVINERPIQVIWVGDVVTTDLVYDLKVSGGDHINSSVDQIKQLLIDRESISAI